MLSRDTKQIIAGLFLFAFLLIKASGLHALTHAHDSLDEVSKCTLCHLSKRDNHTPLISFDTNPFVAEYLEVVFIQITDFYEFLFSDKPEVSELFNKPPPTYSFHIGMALSHQ